MNKTISPELYHYGVKGMKWGVRRSIKKAKKSGRLIDDGNPDVMGVRQKNGDILFVSRKDIYKLGVDEAEKRSHEYIRKATEEALRKAGKKSVNDAKKDLNTRIENAFKNHPELYDDFGGPDKVDDVEFLQLVMADMYGFDDF